MLSEWTLLQLVTKMPLLVTKCFLAVHFSICLMGYGFSSKCQEGAVAGQEVPGLLQAPQFQTVGLLQFNGEAHEETQRTSEIALTQQEVRQEERTLFKVNAHVCVLYIKLQMIIEAPLC